MTLKLERNFDFIGIFFANLIQSWDLNCPERGFNFFLRGLDFRMRGLTPYLRGLNHKTRGLIQEIRGLNIKEKILNLRRD